MKKSSKIILSVLVVAVVLFGTYRIVNKAPSTSLDSNAQMAEIIESSGCMACHTANPQLPFYANFPFAGKLTARKPPGWRWLPPGNMVCWFSARCTWLPPSGR